MDRNSYHVKKSLSAFLRNKFELQSDSALQEEVIENIQKGVEFKGTNLWILIFAIIVASVGLNVNSTAVIIGAMLISPIMGPIMGFGLSLGIYDFALLKKSLRNFGFAVLVGLLASSAYFFISPLSVAQSELLARTSPTAWDVLIAFFGGLAGIVAQSRKDRTSTVIPGVAIATALMPPLCTAGYGLATFQFNYLFGALYLFFINAVFIALATFIIVRFLKYDKKTFVDSATERKVRNYVMLTTIITIVPSVILAYGIVQSTLFNNNVKMFVDNNFVFDNSIVIDYKAHFARDKRSIDVTMTGEAISQDAIVAIRNNMAIYGLGGAVLNIKQNDYTNNQNVSIESIDRLYTLSNTLIKEKDQTINELSGQLKNYLRDTLPVKEISREFFSISGIDAEFALAKMPVYGKEGVVIDSMLLCFIRNKVHASTISPQQIKQLEDWMKVRAKSNRVKIVME